MMVNTMLLSLALVSRIASGSLMYEYTSTLQDDATITSTIKVNTNVTSKPAIRPYSPDSDANATSTTEMIPSAPKFNNTSSPTNDATTTSTVNFNTSVISKPEIRAYSPDSVANATSMTEMIPSTPKFNTTFPLTSGATKTSSVKFNTSVTPNPEIRPKSPDSDGNADIIPSNPKVNTTFTSTRKGQTHNATYCNHFLCQLLYSWVLITGLLLLVLICFGVLYFRVTR